MCRGSRGRHMSLHQHKSWLTVLGLIGLLAVVIFFASIAMQPVVITVTAVGSALLGAVATAVVSQQRSRRDRGGNPGAGRTPFGQLTGADGEAGRLMQDFAEFCARMDEQRTAFAQLALLDPLTGVHNRLGGETLLTRIGAPLDDPQRPLSVAVVDVDNLRELNAALGHAHGDAGLRRVALELEAALRVEDWVARWGGDEFLVVCHCDGEEMHAVMERVRRRLGTRRADAVLPAVSISVGVAELTAAEPMHTCIARADAALFTAKAEGRDTVRTAATLWSVPTDADASTDASAVG